MPNSLSVNIVFHNRWPSPVQFSVYGGEITEPSKRVPVLTAVAPVGSSTYPVSGFDRYYCGVRLPDGINSKPFRSEPFSSDSNYVMIFAAEA
jgi:hypothetical protein